jgi:hypothetical protein
MRLTRENYRTTLAVSKLAIRSLREERDDRELTHGELRERQAARVRYRTFEQAVCEATGLSRKEVRKRAGKKLCH